MNIDHCGDLNEVSLLINEDTIFTRQGLMLAEKYFSMEEAPKGLIIIENLLLEGTISFRFPKRYLVLHQKTL
jgi:hypothetical protein